MSDNIIDIFGADRPLEDRPKLHIDMERACAKMQGVFATDLAAYVLVGVSRTGQYSVGYHIDSESVIGCRMLAGLCAEAIREDLIVDRAIERHQSEQD